MTPHKTKLRQLSIGAIEQSTEIQAWLSQFNSGQQPIAKMLLSHVRFVSWDEFSSWLRQAIGQLPSQQVHALYSVRKLEPERTDFWDASGSPISRPGDSLGSEDLVYSLISNCVRAGNGRLLDHPSLSILKSQKIRSYVLVDDSIGSGDRVSGFINAMLKSPTFLSWWSFGWIRFHVVSFARPREAETKIIAKIRGSDHGKRHFRKSEKIDFASEIVYETDWYEARWGTQYEQVIELCRRQTRVPAKWRLGYGAVAANIIFYHSVPNNLPGVLWYSKEEKWQGLMPERAVPDWLLALLDQDRRGADRNIASISEEIYRLLALVKHGVRRPSSVALRLSLDQRYAQNLILHAEALGLLTSHTRLTPVGLDCLMQSNKIATMPKWDHSLYIPTSWCAGRAPVQPLADEGSAFRKATHSVVASVSTDGDVGQASLERSDAKAATPPFSVMPQSPSMSRESHDTDGPEGSKER